MRRKLLRFVVAEVHPDSLRPSGPFQILRRLERSGSLSSSEEEQLHALRAWFNAHLERPGRFSNSARPHRRAVAISWFKPNAREHIAKMRELAVLLQAHGYSVAQVQTSRPGYVVYEDEFQVTAIPFSDGSA